MITQLHDHLLYLNGPVSLKTYVNETMQAFWKCVSLDVTHRNISIQHRIPQLMTNNACYVQVLNKCFEAMKIKETYSPTRTWIETLHLHEAFDSQFRMNITAMDVLLRSLGLGLEYWNTRTMYDNSTSEDTLRHVLDIFLQVLFFKMFYV